MSLRRQFVSLVLLAVLLVVASSTVYGLEPVRSMGSASPTGSVRGAALSPDEQYLYLAGVQDFAVWKFEVATGKVVAIASLAAAMQRLVDAASGLWESGRLDGLLEPEDDPYVRRLDAALEAARPVLAGARAVMERVGSSEV